MKTTFTKTSLRAGLKGKEKTKTYEAINKLPNNFKGEMPKNIAKGVSRMKNIDAKFKAQADSVLSSEQQNSTAKKPEQKKRQSSGEY